MKIKPPKKTREQRRQDKIKYGRELRAKDAAERAAFNEAFVNYIRSKEAK